MTHSHVTPFLFAAALLAVFTVPDAHSATLEIMVEDAAAPQSRKDGTGYANDIVKAAYHAQGIAVKLDVVPYTRCKASVVAGTVVACFSMSWEAQFLKTVVFSDQPLFTVHPEYFRRISTAPAIRSELDIPEGAVVGLVNGYEYPASLEHLRDRGIIFQYANSEAINLRKLSAGRIDFAVLMLTNVKTAAVPMRDSGVNDVVYAFQSHPIGAYVGFSRHSAQEEYARAQFNRGYAAITANGTLRAIVEKWKRMSN